MLVKLKDGTGIFHDIAQPEKTLTGKAVMDLQETNKVKVALRNGVIEKASKEEQSAYELEQKKIAAASATSPVNDTHAAMKAAVKEGVSEAIKEASAGIGTVKNEDDDKEDYTGESWTVAELKKELDARGVEYKTGDLKADLQKLLVDDDAKA